MEDPTTPDGAVLLELGNRGSARFILGYGVVFALGGVVVASFRGDVLPLVTVAPLPFFIWMSRRLGRRRIVFTTTGVLCAGGGGSPELDDFVPWETILRVTFVTKKHRMSDGTPSYAFSLSFERGEAESVRYPFPSRPSDETLAAIVRMCSERDVATAGF